MITAISGFNASNSKVRANNYGTKSNYISKSNQLADTFTNSKYASKIAFTGGNPLKLVKNESKVVEKVAQKATASASKAIKKLTNAKNELPVTKKPTADFGDIGKGVKAAVVDLSDGLKHDPEISKAMNPREEATEAVSKALKKVNSKEEKLPITEKPVVAAANGYTDPIIEKIIKWNAHHPGWKISVPASGDTQGAALAQSTLNSYISRYDPNFTGAIADAATDLIGEGTIEAAKTAASEAGQYIAEEVLGEGVCQAIERGLDCVLPGVGVLITAARWGRRAYKVGKIIDKL